MKKKSWVALIATLIIVAGGGIYAWRGNLIKQASTSVVAKPTNPIEVPQESPKDSGRVNILLLGSDTRGNDAGRTDSMILLSADTKNKHVSMISIPRDTRVNLPGIGLTKITHANAVGEVSGGVHSGTLASVQAASDLLGVTINDYVKIDFEGFKKVIDEVGGIDVNLPEAIQDINLKAGNQHLNGDMALKLARDRYGLKDGDFGRQRDQALLLSALGDKMLSLENLPKLPQVLTIIHQDLMDTNLSDPQILALGTEFKGVTKDSIKYFQLPGKGISAHDPLVGANVYYYEPEMAGVKKVVTEALQY